ncbi:MAG: aspartate--tRNA(Asn) ligase [Chloroflexia bacterium]|nr:aspartate--tRNA(Asn) ligase [Chloroflexia bacterium]
MERTWTTALAGKIGQLVRLMGWLHRLRQHRNVSFLVLRDAKGLAQIVVEDPALVERVAALHAESVLAVTGVVVARPEAPGGVEVHQPVFDVITAASEPPPFDLFRPRLPAQLPTILDHAPVALRHPRHRAYFQLAAALTGGFRATLRDLDFTEIQTPKLVAGATESGADVFPVDYFGQTAYLAQSPQFYKQMMVGVFERVYEVGPVFRAEPHDTPRHLNEYVSLDAEMGFITDHTEVMAVLSRVLAGMLGAVRAEAAAALTLLELELPEVPAAIPSLHFTEAVELVSTATGEDARHEPDLAPAHERWLGDWAKREHGSDFLFVVGYPMRKRPFYTHPDPHRPDYSNGFDLIFRGLELVTGGQRLHRHEDYLTTIAARGLSASSLAGYLDAFKHGMPPHGGFAIGLERFVARLVGADNIRETTLFPRDLHRLTP